MKNIALIEKVEELTNEFCCKNFFAFYKIDYMHFDRKRFNKFFDDVAVNVLYSDKIMMFSIDNPSCYSSDIGKIIADSIRCRFGVDYVLYDKIVTSLHEVITNAVIHGNCKVRKCYDSHRKLLEFSDKMREEMNKEKNFNKRVNIYVVLENDMYIIKVIDEGNSIINIPMSDDCCTPYSGNGIKILNVLADKVILNEPGTVEMVFARS